MFGTGTLVAILDGIVPVFGTMVAGFAAVRVGWMDRESVRGLGLFAFNVAIPLLLFRSLAGTPLPGHIPWLLVFSFYAGAGVCFSLGVVLGRVAFHRRPDERVIFGMSAGYTNLLLLGFPILLAAYGPDVILPSFVLIAFHSPVLIPLSIWLIHRWRGSAPSPRPWSRRVLWTGLANPVILGLAAGVAANLTGSGTPRMIDRMAEMLASSAIPCALIASGGSLAGYPVGGNLKACLLLSAIKTVLHPLLVWLLADPVLGMSGLWVRVAVCMAGMPTGVNAYVIADRYESAPEFAAQTVFLSTVTSAATIPLMLVLLR